LPRDPFDEGSAKGPGQLPGADTEPSCLQPRHTRAAHTCSSMAKGSVSWRPPKRRPDSICTSAGVRVKYPQPTSVLPCSGTGRQPLFGGRLVAWSSSTHEGLQGLDSCFVAA
jgi:hypothetical protein